ncbi:MAG TPA: hypothetical protein EYQ31_07710 [Candidatus Handelsmanbacteria bacterium]|nr:hypothetical protein [Candidatus Handelsmanbacteria bacterium]
MWVSKRGLTGQEMSALVEERRRSVNLDSVSGTLLNISEGGAAIRIEMDQVMFWSGDPTILFGETRAGVMSMEEKEDGHIPPSSLHRSRSARPAGRNLTVAG